MDNLQGQKAQMRRERNAKAAGKAANSQLKVVSCSIVDLSLYISTFLYRMQQPRISFASSVVRLSCARPVKSSKQVISYFLEPSVSERSGL